MIKSLLPLLALAAATSPALEWEEIALLGSPGQYHNSSSQLGASQGGEETEAGRGYSAANLVDGDFTTIWAEGDPGDGTGQTVWVDIPQGVRTVNIFSGHGKSRSLHLKNNRPKRARLSFYAGISPPGCVTEIARAFRALKCPGDFYIDLRDTFGLQSFPLPASLGNLDSLLDLVRGEFPPAGGQPPDPSCLILRLDIAEVYRGTKWNDACISEIVFGNVYVADSRRPRYPGADNIRVDPMDQQRILADLPGKKGQVILNDPGQVLDLSEVSPNQRWATVIRMEAGPGEGRRETEWLLLDVSNGKVVNREVEESTGIPLAGPFFLKQRGEWMVLEAASAEVLLY
jgi:hypothetical protein